MENKKRSFVFGLHVNYGHLILVGKAKKSKGRPQHGQLPGGHVDLGESYASAAAREFYEETGVNLSTSPERFVPVLTNTDSQYKGRRYLAVSLSNSDSVSGPTAVGPTTGEEGFLLRLSKEHVAFYFEKNTIKASEAIRLHSKGYNSVALCTAKEELMRICKSIF